MSTFRHYNISIIVTTQYIKELPPLFRDVTNYAILFQQMTEPSIKEIHETFMMDKSKDEIHQIMKKLEVFHFIFINCRARNNRYSKALSNKVPKFRIKIS